MIVILRLIILNIDLFLACVLLDLVVVTGCKSVDIYYAAMREDLVVDERWELVSTQSESYMTPRSCIKEACLCRIDTLQELHGLTLLFEVDQIFVVLIDLNVCEGTPGVLKLFRSDLLLGLLINLLATFLVAAPRPLNLYGSDMVHGKAMIFE